MWGLRWVDESEVGGAASVGCCKAGLEAVVLVADWTRACDRYAFLVADWTRGCDRYAFLVADWMRGGGGYASLVPGIDLMGCRGA